MTKVSRPMRTHLDIISDLNAELLANGFEYEFKALKNEVSHHFTATELIGEVGSLLLKMQQKESIKNSVGGLIDEFVQYSKNAGIHSTPSKTYSLQQKELIIDGNQFSDLKGFFNEIGAILTEGNKWGKNWNALNDILHSGFIKTEYGEPFILIWKNSEKSKGELQDYLDLVDLIREHQHIDLRLE